MKSRPWPPTLARQVDESARHEARLAWSPFAGHATAVCETCGRSWRVVDEADGLAAEVIGHAPRVVLRDTAGVVLGDGAEEQQRARANYDAGDDTEVRTVSDEIRARARARAAEIGAQLFRQDGKEEHNVEEEEVREGQGVNEAIRSGIRRGAPLTQAAGRQQEERAEQVARQDQEEEAARDDRTMDERIRDHLQARRDRDRRVIER